jgi:hypothetical protein
MNGNATRFIRFGAGLVGLMILAWALTGQAAKPAQHGIPLPTDWSHRHLIFSRPATAQQFAQVESDPRYWQQMHRRSLRLALPGYAENSELNAVFHSAAQSTRKLHRDWAEDLGTGATVGGEIFPAKWSFSTTTANCGGTTTPDYVVFSTGLTGSSSQANIVAYDNLYSGCPTGTVPSVYWAYNITDAHIGSGKILTSPVPSLDGSQIAFVQDNGISASLILLKWAASTTETVSSPGTATAVGNGSYRGCGAPCMTTIDLRAGGGTTTQDTTSSVFYDYTNDIAWVGDSEGWLHQFTGVFKGTPAEVRTGGFPVQMPSHYILSSPVFDRISKTVFVGDYSGFLNRVDATTAAVTQSGELDFGAGIVDGVIADVLRGLVYVFASEDNSAACNAGADDCAGVFQLSTTFAAGDLGTEIVVGTSSFGGSPLPNPMYDGFFDNAYLESANGTGNLYVCGNTGANPTLYVVPIQAGTPGTPAVIGTLATAGFSPACSPVTDIFTPGATAGSAATERLFVSVQGNSTAAGCGGAGCIQNLINTPWQASTSFTVGQEILIKASSPLVRFINVVITAGTSGAAQPSWPTTSGMTKTDGGVVWINQGNPALAIKAWVANNTYGTVGARILDSNGNVQVVKTTVAPHLSGGSPPSWNTTLGGLTSDNNITWVNAGTPPTKALSAAGGTSGIIIDNTVSPGTLGTSQVYFSTQADQTCITSGGTGGCAVQASQSDLQ